MRFVYEYLCVYALKTETDAASASRVWALALAGKYKRKYAIRVASLFVALTQ